MLDSLSLCLIQLVTMPLFVCCSVQMADAIIFVCCSVHHFCIRTSVHFTSSLYISTSFYASVHQCILHQYIIFVCCSVQMADAIIFVCCSVHHFCISTFYISAFYISTSFLFAAQYIIFASVHQYILHQYIIFASVHQYILHQYIIFVCCSVQMADAPPHVWPWRAHVQMDCQRS